MKTFWMLFLTAIAACAQQAPEPDLVIFVYAGNADPSVFVAAEKQAARIFSAAGLSVGWRSGELRYTGRADVTEVVLSRPVATFKPAALAFAELGPNSRGRVVVFYNRIHESRSDAEVTSLLAYVLVHEITHVVEGVRRHSSTGIMKAYWNPYDHQLIRSNSFRFADEDLRLIHASVERHKQPLLAARISYP